MIEGAKNLRDFLLSFSHILYLEHSGVRENEVKQLIDVVVRIKNE